MKHEVLAPHVGESITEVTLLKWTKQSGQVVRAGEPLLEIESDKATVEIVAEVSGALTIQKSEGERVRVGEVIGAIDDSVQTAPEAPAQEPRRPVAVAAGPAVRKVAEESGIDLAQVAGTGKAGRVTKGDLLKVARLPPDLRAVSAGKAGSFAPAPGREGERRVPMSPLRMRIAERLLQAQHSAAILTTFNEADMGAIMALRKQHKEAFRAKYGVSLGFMSFFTRASVEALKAVPEVNASIDGSEIVYHDYYSIGIAVGTDRGLVVPVLRHADKMSFAEIEKNIAELAFRAHAGKLAIPDLTGGTFSISNGGVYGSLLSTPILNPPQSGILGMHKIQERPVVIDGKLEIRPMMYLALSYDHRLVDGKGAVSFLVTLKDFLEHPEKLKWEH